jgi:hypothetical protein
MKFTELYNQVFVKEQNDDIMNKEVADPADFNDVAPLPLPEPTEEQPIAPAVTGTTLTEYIAQLEDFANKLNSTDGGSLQALVSSLDKKDTPFEGIYSRTSLDILNTAKTLREIAETIKNFIIHASKK